MRLTIYAFVLSLFFLPALSSSAVDVETYGGKDRWKKMQAWFRYNDGDYHGALRMYRVIYKQHKTEPRINYRMGKCYLAIKEMDKAIEHFELAKQLNAKNKKRKYKAGKDLLLVLGQAYQFNGFLDKAIAEYNAYKINLPPARMKDDLVNDYLAQCHTAKAQMANPVDVSISNLGSAINSMYDDGAPSLSADNQTLIFTSRRPDTEGGGIDPATGQYYDDIYMAKWDPSRKKWKEAQGVEGSLNSEGHDASLSISPDGQMIFVYRNIPGETKSGDIFYSRLKNEEWSKPRAFEAPINSSYFETSACLSPDGNYLYFVSERKGGYGNADIYRSKRISNKEWSDPENLGPVINTVFDELGVFIHPDGQTLFFTSKGHTNMGGYDVFVSRLENGEWSEPVNLGYPINTTKDEIHFIMTLDGKRAYIASRKPEGLGGADIYEIDMSRYRIPIESKDSLENTEPEKPAFNPELSILKGKIIDSDAAQAMEGIKVSVLDPETENEIANTLSTSIGEYFFTLKGGKEYVIRVSKKGYYDFKEKISLELGTESPFTLVKTVVLYRLPE